MHVIATAGHVDHGKSTLLRTLTGMEPDRLPEERRRGLTVDLGFVWTTLDGEDVAFVDVPGHERFVSTMLAGVGAVPLVLFVVAADEGWMPQSAEHLDALAAYGVEHVVLAITKGDLASPLPARDTALREFGRAGVPVDEVVWARDGLREALIRVARKVPRLAAETPVRLWVDRAFTVHGAGTVVTGTLQAGTIHVGDRLDLVRASRGVVVRGLQALGRPVDSAVGPARVALNLRAVDRREVSRGDALATPGTYAPRSVVDVRVRDALPRRAMVHVGSAAVPARVRVLGPDVVRLSLRAALPLRTGERVLLRHERSIVGGTVLEPAPPRTPRMAEPPRPTRTRTDRIEPSVALGVLAGLESPFTVSGARQALESTRRIVVPLLEATARAGLTVRTEDGRHRLTERGRTRVR